MWRTVALHTTWKMRNRIVYHKSSGLENTYKQAIRSQCAGKRNERIARIFSTIYKSGNHFVWTVLVFSRTCSAFDVCRKSRKMFPQQIVIFMRFWTCSLHTNRDATNADLKIKKLSRRVFIVPPQCVSGCVPTFLTPPAHQILILALCATFFCVIQRSLLCLFV